MAAWNAAGASADLEYAIQFWNARNGLPEESIYSILETPDGYLWLATRDRLVRFDGKTFQAIDPVQGQLYRDTGIGSLAWDGKRLWVGARDYVAYAELDSFGSFTNLKFRSFRFPRTGGDRFGIADMQLAGGKLLVRRTDGVFEIDLATVDAGRWSEPRLIVAPNNGESIGAMLSDGIGLTHYATDAGIYERAGNAWRLMPKSPAPVAVLARALRLFAFGVGELYELAGGWRSMAVPRAATIENHRGLSVDADGTVWAGMQGGIIRIQGDDRRRHLLAEALRPDDSVICFHRTRDGALWFGTRWGTLGRMETPRFQLFDAKKQLASSAVSAVYEDEAGRVWIGCRTHGLYVADREALKFRPIASTGGARILHAVAGIGSGRVVFADTNGLWLSDGGPARLVRARTMRSEAWRYQAFSQVHNGRLYYGDSEAVYELTLDNGAVRVSEPKASVLLTRAIVADDEGFWAMSWESGLVRKQGSKLIAYGLAGGGSERRGMTLFSLNDRWFLIGTSSGSLLFDRKNARFAPLAELLPGESVFGFQQDSNGNLWVLGRRGLLVTQSRRVIEWAEGRASQPVFTRFTASDGLASGNFGLGTSSLSTLAKDGRVWLASLSGAIRFSPADVLATHTDVRTAVDGLAADGARVPVANPVDLPSGTRRVGLHFTTLGRLSARTPLYRYQLSGIQAAPVETLGQDAVFENLTPGEYRFSVQSQIADHGWRGTPAVVVFRIPPFWYQTLWARVLASTAVIFAAWAYWRHRIQSLRRRAEMLERRVAARTEELLAERDRAEAASRAKSQFLASMSHEIRTPLNGVLGAAQLLDASQNESERQWLMETLRASGAALQELVNDLLDLAKIESGEVVLEKVSFSMREIGEQCRQIFDRPARDKGIELRIEIDREVPNLLTGDPGRLRQVIVNLLGNAIKFTAIGHVCLRIARAGLGRYSIEVEDTGIGIPADQQTRIFEPFTQADSSTTRKFGGTGLGLAICRRLVQAMSGFIELRSEVDRGTVITVLVPLSEQLAPPVPSPPPLNGTPGRPRVLLVEDNPVNRQIANAMLRRLGCDVREAVDGEFGVAAAAAEPFDLILLDLYMPNLDGFGAFRAIRDGEGPNRQTPVWALTASGLSEDRLRCEQEGMQGHLSKPVSVAALQAALSSLRAPTSADDSHRDRPD